MDNTPTIKRLERLLSLTIENKASDLHLAAGYYPMIRVNGVLYPIGGEEVLTAESAKELVLALAGENKEKLLEKKEVDFSYSYEDKGDFRVNAYHQQQTLAACLRFLQSKIPAIEELNLSPILKSLAQWKQGFVLVAGPTGHGKSTTLASILEEINQTRGGHIITIEDPVEYRMVPKKCLISQREIGQDTLSWGRALRSALREDPNVVFVGEMRDLETISAALTVAETGHLVLSTLHTNSAAETVDRIIDAFPAGSKEQIRLQLANVLGAVISQRLVPTIKPGRVPATELLFSSMAVKTAIRDGKTHMIDNIIQTSGELGMNLLEVSLADWVKKGVISREVAEAFCLRREELVRNLRRKNA